MMSFRRTTDPTVEPVTLKDFRDWAGIDSVDDTAKLTMILRAARELCEKYLEMALMEQSWTVAVDAWPSEGRLELPMPPLISITELRYSDADGNFTAVDSSNYWIDTNAKPGVLYLKDGVSVTTTRSQRGIEVEYKAGFGTDADDVPNDFKAAVLQAAADIYDTGAVELSMKATAALGLLRVLDL